jgi:hypothetical protein
MYSSINIPITKLLRISQREAGARNTTVPDRQTLSNSGAPVEPWSPRFSSNSLYDGLDHNYSRFLLDREHPTLDKALRQAGVEKNVENYSSKGIILINIISLSNHDEFGLFVAGLCDSRMGGSSHAYHGYTGRHGAAVCSNRLKI